MRKLLASLAAILAVSSFACSGGNDDVDVNEGGAGGEIAGAGGIGGGGSGGSIGEGGSGGAGGEGGMDCAYLQSEANCWNRLVATIDCLPPQTETGEMNEERTSCVYSRGLRIDFSNPAPANFVLPTEWDFTITEGGECVRLVETRIDGDYALELTVRGQTARIDANGDATALTCPDGSIEAGPMAPLIDRCMGDVPGHYQTLNSFGLRASGEVELFTCMPAPAP